MEKAGLSQKDVARLLTETSVEAKKNAASKLAEEMERGDLSPKEKELAADIFRLMAHDAEIAVRAALVENERCCSVLPRDVALFLTEDEDCVALPVLEHSRSLTDEDLVEAVEKRGEPHQIAIARRQNLAPRVSEALIDKSNPAAIRNLVSNQTARISESGFQKVVDAFGEKQDIQSALISRPELPPTVVERLVAAASEQLRAELASKHKLSPEKVAELLRASREKAVITLTAGIDRESAQQLVNQMFANGRLTPSIILRSICMGDIAFFESSMACKGRVPYENALMLIYDPGGNGFKALYEQAQMPAAMYKAFVCALEVSKNTDFDGGDLDRERYCQRMIERILTQYKDGEISMDSLDIDFLLGKMDQLQSVIETQTQAAS